MKSIGILERNITHTKYSNQMFSYQTHTFEFNDIGYIHRETFPSKKLAVLPQSFKHIVNLFNPMGKK